MNELQQELTIISRKLTSKVTQNGKQNELFLLDLLYPTFQHFIV